MADERNVQTIDDLGMDPLTAFAKLRTYTPDRACFLLESGATDTPEGRFSIVGYRVRKGDLSPPGIDPVRELTDIEAQDQPESFALALAAGCVAIMSYSGFAHKRDVPWCPDDGPSAIYLHDATVMVFDHQENTVTIAGRVKGKAVERCIWEAKNGPAIEPLGELDATATPTPLQSVLTSEQLSAKAKRAQAFLGDEVEQLALAHIFTAGSTNADAFDVYRAMRELQPGRHMYYVDTGESPVAPHIECLGTTAPAIHVRRRGESGEAVADACAAKLPHASIVGPGGEWAAKLAQRLEQSSRQFFGGLVGYMAPGGEAGLVLADRNVLMHHSMFEHGVTVPVTEQTDPDTLPALALERAQLTLAAIAAAQARAGRPTA